MGLLKIFTGKTPQEHEQQGDTFAQAEAWGKAKIEYEKALSKLEKSSPDNVEFKNHLEEKIIQSKEALARGHKKSAEDMLKADFYEEARQYVGLALELTADPQLRQELKDLSQQLNLQIQKEIQELAPDFEVFNHAEQQPLFVESEDEEFRVLIGRLPAEVQKAYLSYGDEFEAGYMALNQGDFQQAASHLSNAMQDHPAPDSLIPLELATAYLNLEKFDEAQQLLEIFLQQHPDALPAYQLLCEIFWENKEYDKAETLLASIPPELTESVAVYLLRGETLYHARKYPEAKLYYQDFLKNYEWNESVARVLAKTHEALGEMANARYIYREIMDQCRSCRARVDPYIKFKYADLCFSSGLYTSEILELYLSLVQEIPAHAAQFYQKISQIYSAQGNEAEAKRFQRFAEKHQDGGT
jgi:tetratricopeptide (TPR) repeat protein